MVMASFFGSHVREFLYRKGQRIFHAPVTLALDQGIAPFMEDPVGDLHLQGIDGGGHVGVQHLRLHDEGFKVRLYRRVQIRDVFPHCL